jgi:hypothetical protein
MHVARDWVTFPNRTDQTWYTRIICALTYADLQELFILVHKTADHNEIHTVIFTVSKESPYLTLTNPIHQRDILNRSSPILKALEVSNQLETIHITGVWQFFFNALLTVDFQRKVVHVDLSTEAIRSGEHERGF